VVKVITTAAVEVVIAGEWIPGVCPKAEAIAVRRTSAVIAEPEVAVVTMVMPVMRLGGGRQGCEPQGDACYAYKLQHLQPLDLLPCRSVARLQKERNEELPLWQMRHCIRERF